MGNQTSNKTFDCRSIQTLSLWLLSLEDTNTADTDGVRSWMSSPYYGSFSSPLPRKVSNSTFMLHKLHLSVMIWTSYWSLLCGVCVGLCVCMLRCMFITFDTVTVSAPVSLQGYEDSYEYAAYDMQPLNCSTTESIKGGHVTYSQVKNNTLDTESWDWLIYPSAENAIILQKAPNILSF